MKCPLKILCIILFISIKVSAGKPDSLLKVLNGQPTDTAWLRKCGSVIDVMIRNDLDKAGELANRAMEKAVRINRELYNGLALYASGTVDIFTGKADSGLARLSRASVLLARHGFLKESGQSDVKIANYYLQRSDFERSNKYYNKALSVFEKIKDTVGLGIVYHGQAYVKESQGDYAGAMTLYNKALVNYRLKNDINGIAGARMNMGAIYQLIGWNEEALNNFLEAEKMAKQIQNPYAIGVAYANIANIYAIMKEMDKAEKYFLDALEINRQIRNLESVSNIYLSLSNIKKMHGKFDEARQLITKAYEIDVAEKNYDELLYDYSHFGDLYKETKDLAGAEVSYNRELKLADSLGIVNHQADAYYKLGELENKKGNNSAAVKFMERALNGFSMIGAVDRIQQCYGSLSALYASQKNFEKAYEAEKNFKIFSDSLSVLNNNNSMTRTTMRHEFDKENEAKKVEQIKKDAEAGERIFRQKLISIGAGAIALLVIVFSVFLYNRFRLISAQKVIIEEQKHKIQEKNTEMLDSIAYARRLQQAILPPPGLVKKYFPESFVLYKPKDIVAGDFYWMETVSDTDRGHEFILIAAGDSTGHGVPGAMVSVVCSNALNRAVKEFGLSDPARILDKARDLVLETFSKSSEDVKDGMDISLLAINKNTKEFAWSGANNPLWYVSNGEMKELKADKQPVGKSEKPLPFTLHTEKYLADTCFYLFTDGYADQFGGPKGKKFKYKQLQENLLKISLEKMEQQKQLLENSFYNWKGSLEQIDDVCIIGIRV